MRQKFWRLLIAICGAVLALGLASGAFAAVDNPSPAGGLSAGPHEGQNLPDLGPNLGLPTNTGKYVNGAEISKLANLIGQPVNSPTAQEHLKRDAVCTTCHDETDHKHIISFFQTPHGVIGDDRTPTCQSCHGESEKHLAGPEHPDGIRPPPDRVFGAKLSTTAHYEPSTPQEQSEVCLGCHKGSLRMRWPGSQHQSNDVACTNCHVNHDAVDHVRDRFEQPDVCFTCHKDKRAEFHKISHMPIETGKVDCADCHNPHGSGGPKLLVKNTVNETCFTCHADKRGPFLWEHQPATEDCTTCHTPHGSNITPLLKDRPPFLCESCHNGPHNSITAAGTGTGGIQSGGVAAGGNPSQMITGRACLNCHVMVHGSNSPAGAFLHR